jgi:hypothetical protein
MDDNLFAECTKHYEANESMFWGKLASQYGFATGNALRKRYQRARKSRGMSLKVKIGKGNPSDYVTQTKTKVVVRKDFPKILFLDIETSLLLLYAFGIYDQNIPIDNIVQDYHLISWSAKWIFNEKVESMVLTPEEAIAHNDKRIAMGIWDLVNEADIVVHFNGDKFDMRRMNTRFMINKLPPPNPYRQSVDLLKHVRRICGNTSNKLNYVNKILGLSLKIENSGMELWRKCFEGDAESLLKMEAYNRGDVVITESLYLEILPWITNHPNLNIWSDSETAVCKNCGNSMLTWLDKYYYTSNAKYQTCKCEKCGSYGRSKVNLVTKEKRRVNIA